MRKRRTAIACLCLICAFNLHAAEHTLAVFFETDSLSHAEPLAITEFIDDWGGPFHGGDAAFTINRAELGMRHNGWRLSYLARYDYFIDTHADTAEAYYQSENKLPFDTGRRYRAKINVNHIQARGLKAGRRLTLLPNLSLDIDISYLVGQRLTKGQLSGHITALSDKDYDFDVNVDYAYSKDHLFDRVVEPPSGKGFSLDLELHWQATQRLTLNLEANDVLSRIVWRDAPYTEAIATSDTKEFDENGFVTVNPTISGFEGNTEFVQELWPVYLLAARYDAHDRVKLIGEYLDTRVKAIPRLGATLLDRRRGSISALWGFTTQALTLRYVHGVVDLSLTADKTDITEAQTLGMQASIDLRW